MKRRPPRGGAHGVVEGAMKIRFLETHVLLLALVLGGAPGGLAYKVNTADNNAPVKWTTPSAAYVVNVSGAPADFLGAVLASMQTWTDVPESDFAFAYNGTTASHTWGDMDGVNVVDFGALTSTFEEALGVNTFWFTSTGQMLGSDIRLNSRYAFSTNGQAGTYDLQSLMTHELGHSLSLADLYDSQDAAKVMYGFLHHGDTSKRTLHWDDRDGIAYLYPSPTPPVPPGPPPGLYLYVNTVTGMVMIDVGHSVEVNITIEANGSDGYFQDWWAVVCSPFGWFALDASGQWVPVPDLAQLKPAYQGRVMDLVYCRLLYMHYLPEGTYTFYFGLDTMNGVLDGSGQYVATRVIVSNLPGALPAAGDVLPRQDPP
jgi:predicted Zn-dependent protease